MKEDMPSPNSNGWASNNGHCYPVRYSCPAIPKNILDLVQRSSDIIAPVENEQDEDETGEADESDIDTDEEVDSDENDNEF